MKLALIKNNIVKNIILGDISDFPDYVNVDGVEAQMGWTDNLDGTFSKPLIDLNKLKNSKVEKVNPEANKRISALDWKVTRDTERKQRGRATQSVLDAVLDERENIRLASDAAIIAINALTSIEEVKAFTW